MAAATIETKSVADMCRRNVVVVGKTGAGKSTVANKILEGRTNTEERFTVSHRVLASVTDAIKAESSLLKTRDDVEYIVQVVDTIGLFDNKPGSNNFTIMKDVKTFFRKRIPEGLNLILFVFKQGRWTDEEQKTFDLFTTNFVGTEISSISGLVVTGCDGFTSEKKESLKEEFRNSHPNISEFMQKGIHTVSFPNLDTLLPEIKAIHVRYQKADQETLRKLVYNSDEMKLSKDIVQEAFWNKILSNCKIL